MNEVRTISEVSKLFGVSTRTLRYYEQIGLLDSQRIEGYSYRVYDEQNCLKLRQIIILRKLRISLKQIESLLKDYDVLNAVDVFLSNISSLNEEINSLSTIRNILLHFITELKTKTGISLQSDLLNDSSILSMIEPLSIVKIQIKEDHAMDELNKASEHLNQLTDRDVRIVYLPPATVASYQYEGDEPETQVNHVIDSFVREHDLIHVKPDLRHYGFNCPCPKDETMQHGYEMWVTVPEDMEIPAPLVRKQFAGGLYAAVMIPFGAFDVWERLGQWVKNSAQYEYNGSWNPDHMFGWLEEHLNYVNHVMLENTEPEGLQLDLLMPVKEKMTIK